MIGGVCNITDNSEENKHSINMIVQIMMYHMASYNRDGTGIAIGFTDGSVSYRKTEESGETWSGKVEITKEKDYSNIIMHTRMATQGASTELNAHPFETRHGLMVHNGWCPELYTKNRSKMKTQCDSEALAYIFDPDHIIFNSRLNGHEHFCLAHLSDDGTNVQLWNKNKSQFKMYSGKLSADVFCTSRGVLVEVLGLLQEDVPIEPVPENSIVKFEDGQVTQQRFTFTDAPYISYGRGYAGNYEDIDWREEIKKRNPPNKFRDAADYDDWNRKQAALPARGESGSKPLRKLTRKERKKAKKLDMYRHIFKDFLDEE